MIAWVTYSFCGGLVELAGDLEPCRWEGDVEVRYTDDSLTWRCEDDSLTWRCEDDSLTWRCEDCGHINPVVLVEPTC